MKILKRPPTGFASPVNWDQAWSRAFTKQPDQVEPGFKTMAQLGKELGVSPKTAYWRIRRSGLKFEMRKFKIQDGDQIRSMPHFRPLVAESKD